MGSSRPLDGLRVAELSASIAGDYCGRLLADAGAEVVKIEGPQGSALRRWSASGSPIAPGEDGALFQYLGSSKSSLAVRPSEDAEMDTARQVLRTSDVVIWTRDWELAGSPGMHPHQIAAAAPSGVVAAITPFGLTGPWADRPATDLTLQAWVGGPAIRGRPEDPPLSTGGRIAEWVTGAMAATGVLAALNRREQTRRGELLDVSMLETLILHENMYPVTYKSIVGRPFHAKRYTNLPDIAPSKDGWVGFMVITAQQWMDFCVMIERPDLGDDESLFRYDNRLARREELEDVITAWTSRHSTAEIVELGGLMRVPVAPVGNGADVTTFEHLQVTGAFRTNPRGGFPEPEAHYRMSEVPNPERTPAPALGSWSPDLEGREPAPVPLLGRIPDRPLEGLRVLDMTQFWAGPIVGQLLGMLGADVIHLESVQRVDGMRLLSDKKVTDEQYWEWGPLYHGPNTNKRGLTLNLNDPQGLELAKRLAATCDLVVENFSPRVLSNWGLDYESLAALNPGIVLVRMPAFGLDGPWRDQVGYAQTMEQVTGLAWMTGFGDGRPRVPNGHGDPMSGIHATFAGLLALAHRRRRSGRGQLVEVPMVRTALAVAAEQIVEHSHFGVLLSRDGNRGPEAIPQGLYRCPDDPEGAEQWIAIAVQDGDQWATLLDALDAPEQLRRYQTAAQRRAAADEIDAWLGAACAKRDCPTLVERMWDAGVPVARLSMPHDQDRLPQLAARGWWQEIDHPVIGRSLHGGLPVRFSLGPTVVHRLPPPMLGQHNVEILTGLLGLTEQELAELEDKTVIGTQPGGNTRLN